MHFNDLQEGEMYAVFSRRARLDRLWRDKQGFANAELSMGRSFDKKQTLRAYSRHTKNMLGAIEDTWKGYKQKRDGMRSQARREQQFNKQLQAKLAPLGLKASISPERIEIAGDYDQFEQLLARITSPASPSALTELI